MNQSIPVSTPIAPRLSARIDRMLCHGRVKDPELMQTALEVLTELADATQCLLDYLGQPEDGTQANLMARCRTVITKVHGSAS